MAAGNVYSGYLNEAKIIKLKCLIEGGGGSLLDVPVSAATVTSQPNSSATCSITIPSTDRALYLEPKTRVFVFYSEVLRERVSDVSDSDWKLFFMGELLSLHISHTRLSRVTILNCADFYGCLARIYLYNKSFNQWSTDFQFDFSVIEGGALSAPEGKSIDIGENKEGKAYIDAPTISGWRDSVKFPDAKKDEMGGFPPPAKVYWPKNTPGVSYSIDMQFKTAIDNMNAQLTQALSTDITNKGAKIVIDKNFYDTEGMGSSVKLVKIGGELNRVLPEVEKSNSSYTSLTPAFTQQVDIANKGLKSSYLANLYLVGTKDGEIQLIKSYRGQITLDNLVTNSTSYVAEFAKDIQENDEKYTNIQVYATNIYGKELVSLYPPGGVLQSEDQKEINIYPSRWGLGAVITLFKSDNSRIGKEDENNKLAELDSLMNSYAGGELSYLPIKDSGKILRSADERKFSRWYSQKKYYVWLTKWTTLTKTSGASPFDQYISEVNNAIGDKSNAEEWLKSFNAETGTTEGGGGGSGDTLLIALAHAFAQSAGTEETGTALNSPGSLKPEELGATPGAPTNMAEVIKNFIIILMKGNYINPYIRYDIFRNRLLDIIGGLSNDPYSKTFFDLEYLQETTNNTIQTISGPIITLEQVLQFLMNKVFYSFVPNPLAPEYNSEILSLLFMPSLYFFDTPQCNVILPSEYLNFNWERHSLTEITRLGALLMPVTNQQGNATQPFENNTLSTHIVAPTIIFKNPPDQTELEKIQDHELMTGIVPDWMKISAFMPEMVAKSIVMGGPLQPSGVVPGEEYNSTSTPLGTIEGWFDPVGGVYSYITSGFGNRLHPIKKVYKFHAGVDIGSGGKKVPIYAAREGIVESASGYIISINHGKDSMGVSWKTRYIHLDSLGVSSGQRVGGGSKIGIMGTKGGSTGVHLHFEVYKNGSTVNPMTVPGLGDILKGKKGK